MISYFELILELRTQSYLSPIASFVVPRDRATVGVSDGETLALGNERGGEELETYWSKILLTL